MAKDDMIFFEKKEVWKKEEQGQEQGEEGEEVGKKR